MSLFRDHKPDQKENRTMLDEFFSPDIRIKVSGPKSVIVACEAITKLGAEFLLRNTILEKSYDDIQVWNGLVFEIVE
jgi:hypothetical protein